MIETLAFCAVCICLIAAVVSMAYEVAQEDV